MTIANKIGRIGLRFLFALLLLFIGFFVSTVLMDYFQDKDRREAMVTDTSDLMLYATKLRDGQNQKVINSLDGRINSQLMTLAWNKQISELDGDVLWLWQEAKAYYDKYDVIGSNYSPGSSANAVRGKLEQVPWSQRDVIRRDFEAKYKGPTPQMAPKFNVTNWLGSPLSLEGLRGKVVLLDFWGISCKPCIVGFPKVQSIHERFKDKGLVVIAPHWDTRDLDKVAKLVQKESYTFAVGCTDETTRNEYGVIGIPSYYLIDTEGRLVWGPEHDVPSDGQIEALLKQ